MQDTPRAKLAQVAAASIHSSVHNATFRAKLRELTEVCGPTIRRAR